MRSDLKSKRARPWTLAAAADQFLARHDNPAAEDIDYWTSVLEAEGEAETTYIAIGLSMQAIGMAAILAIASVGDTYNTPATWIWLGLFFMGLGTMAVTAVNSDRRRSSLRRLYAARRTLARQAPSLWHRWVKKPGSRDGL